jgi:hypothetical protein
LLLVKSLFKHQTAQINFQCMLPKKFLICKICIMP